MTLPPTILVIEDDEAIQEFISLAMCDEGYNILRASDGYAALELLTHHRPNLILLDVQMPNMDGYQFLQEYRRQFENPPPIIMLTAKRGGSQSAADLKVQGFLEKPFDLGELIDTVGQWLPTN
jgi:CheY-like chemotaxis protein